MIDLDMILPCDVALPPGTIISKGCRLSTLLNAIDRRREWEDGLEFPDDRDKRRIAKTNESEVIHPGSCYVEADDAGGGLIPDCVLDYGNKDGCIYAENIARREQCKYWK